MDFLANENFPKPSISILRSENFKVFSISEDFPGISDVSVIQKAKEFKAIILTFDSDYGELIFRYSLNNPPSVIYFRYKGKSPDFAGNKLKTLLKTKKINFEGFFTVIEEENIRQRKYN